MGNNPQPIKPTWQPPPPLGAAKTKPKEPAKMTTPAQTTPETPAPMTTRNLRNLLFTIIDQEMTVRELRAMLFNVQDQDAPLKIDFCMFRDLENARFDEIERNEKLKSMLDL